MAPPGNEHPHPADDVRNGGSIARTEDRDKAAWRRHLDAARTASSLAARVADAGRLAEGVRSLTVAGRTVCGYVPFGTEPGSLAMLDVLRTLDARVLLPIVPGEPGPLDWAEYSGTAGLVSGRFRGVLEPAGPRLGPQGVAEAELILVPALAVDRAGVRLGRGAGYYDRSLRKAESARFVAVVRDVELVEALPGEPHDVRMHAALLPSRGAVPLTCSPPV